MTMERPSVVGVTTDKKVAKVTLLDVIDQPGTAARVFRDLAEAEINVRLIIQAAPSHDRNRITFITETEALEPLAALIPSWKKEKLAGKVEIDADVAKIAIVGSRIASTPGLAARMFTALADEGINIDCISTSEMKVACIIAESSLDNAVRRCTRRSSTSWLKRMAPPQGSRRQASRCEARRQGEARQAREGRKNEGQGEATAESSNPLPTPLPGPRRG